ncbi:MAG: ArnT family glycosyltransferase [Terriglobales bacterium]
MGAGACALGWATLLAGLGSFGLVGPDEPRYAAIAAAMARTHQWITPRLWGSPWLEKPILYYWLAALSDGLHHGATAASSRLPNALLAAAMLSGLFFFLRKLRGTRAGVLAVFVGLSSVFVFAFGRAASTDMTLTAPYALGAMALYLWLAEHRLRWLHLTAIAMGLATLAKGPVAMVLAALTLAGYAALSGRWRLWQRLWRPSAILIYFVIAAPWYIAVAMQNGGFFHSFFVQQNLDRMATNLYQHQQPLWFFVPIILLAVFPWCGWFGLPLTADWRRPRDPLPWFLLCWLGAPIVFFSVSASKLPGYILPAVPGAVALIAICAEERWAKLPRWPLVISAVLAGLGPAAVRLTPWFLTPASIRLKLGTVLAHNPGTMIVAAVCILVLLFFALRRRAAALVAATCILTAGSVLALTRPPLSHNLDVTLSGEPLGRQLFAQCGSSLPQRCGMIPVYTWHLDRAQIYGADFVLGGRLAALPEAALPPDALIVVPRRALMRFEKGPARGDNLAVQPRFIPPEARHAPPWVVLRVRRPAT